MIVNGERALIKNFRFNTNQTSLEIQTYRETGVWVDPEKMGPESLKAEQAAPCLDDDDENMFKYFDLPSKYFDI